MILSSPTCNSGARSSSESLLLPLSFPFVVSSNSRPKNASCEIAHDRMDQMIRQKHEKLYTEIRSVKTSEGASESQCGPQEQTLNNVKQLWHSRSFIRNCSELCQDSNKFLFISIFYHQAIFSKLLHNLFKITNHSQACVLCDFFIKGCFRHPSFISPMVSQ
jgi:hypothetical protein